MLKFAPNFFLSLLLSRILVWSSLRAFEVYLYFSEWLLRPAIQEMKKTLEEGSIKNLNIWLFAKRKKAQNNYTWDDCQFLKTPHSLHITILWYIFQPQAIWVLGGVLVHWSVFCCVIMPNLSVIDTEINLRHIDHVNICIVCMSMFIKDSIQKTPMTMVNC